MANLNGYVLTQAGKNLFAKSSSGECKVVFTKAKIGESETTLDELLIKDDLVGTKLKLLDIVSSKAEENKFTIITTVTNSGLEEHFYIRQLGIFAKGLSVDELDTEILPEKLIAVAYDTNPDVIPAETNNIPYTKQMNIGFSINNADKCEIVISLAGVVTSEVLENHNNDTKAHRSLFKSLFNLTDMTLNSMKSIIQNWCKEVCLPLFGGTMKGNINASGYNITATKFIGNLQGKANSATNADLATKANQDSQGQTINTTYVKGITASNATLTLTKGNGTTSTVTINNVGNSTKATQDSQGQAINTTYIKSITASNATLTVTKGNGTTSTVTINNVAHATKADDATNAGNINSGYAEYSSSFPADTFRNDVLGRDNNNSYGLRPFTCLLPNGSYGSSPGVGFGAVDTQGFLQMAHSTPLAYVGAGNEGKIKWSKQLAFTDSPSLTGTPTAPTPSASDNSTKIATTAFVKSLFTASKQKNGWWKDGNTGFIYQWGIGSCSGVIKKTFDFNISFPNTCFNVLACDNGSNARSLGVKAQDNSTFIIYILNPNDFVFYWFAIGY